MHSINQFVSSLFTSTLLVLFLGTFTNFGVDAQTVTVNVYERDGYLTISCRGSLTNVTSLTPGSPLLLPPYHFAAARGLQSVGGNDIALTGYTGPGYTGNTHQVPLSTKIVSLFLTSNGTIPTFGMYTNAFYISPNYVEGTPLVGDLIFYEQTLASAQIIVDRVSYVEWDGGPVAGTQRVEILTSEPEPTEAPTMSPTLSCPCNRLQLVCRIRNGCLRSS